MNRHVSMVHEGKKTFKCDFCDYSCSQKNVIKSHVASVHVESVHGGKKA